MSKMQLVSSEPPFTREELENMTNSAFRLFAEQYLYHCLKNKGDLDGHLSFVSIYRDGFRVKMRYYKTRKLKKSTN